jgi:hypothetical protein
MNFPLAFRRRGQGVRCLGQFPLAFRSYSLYTFFKKLINNEVLINGF